MDKKTKIRVVLVEPKWDLNVGSACRAMKNFGCTELYLVSPAAKLGPDAVKYAKHGADVLKKARKTKSLKQALKGCTVAVGTTGMVRRFGKRMLKKCVSTRDLKKAVGAGDKVALVFGNEESGLDARDLNECDFVAFIPASPEYPVLNISHAVAVVLYEICASEAEGRLKASGGLGAPAPRRKMERLERMFAGFVRNNKSVRDPEKVATAFKRVLRRSRPSDAEIQALYPAF